MSLLPLPSKSWVLVGLNPVMTAVAVLPVPPLVDVTVTELTFTPTLLAVTLRETAQVPWAETVPPARLTVVMPLASVFISAKKGPPQITLRSAGVAAIKPAGRMSVNPTPVSDVKPGFVIAKTREVLLPRCTDAAPNVLVMVGGATAVIVAMAVLPVPLLVDVTVTELFFTPALVAVTLRETEQLPMAASVPSKRLTVPLPAVAVAVPPQVELRPLGVETTSPDGRVSVNATPVIGERLGFVIVNMREVAPPTGMDATPNALVIDGGDAMAGPPYPATMSAAASHIISAARFPTKRRVKHTSTIKRLGLCISTSRAIGGNDAAPSINSSLCLNPARRSPGGLAGRRST